MNRSLLLVISLLAWGVGCKSQGPKPMEPGAVGSGGHHGPEGVSGSEASEPWPLEVREAFFRSLQAAGGPGVVVMSRGPDGLGILEGCTVFGSYDYAKIVQESESLHGFRVYSRPGGKGVAVEGRLSTTLEVVFADELRGSCEGASHYLRAVDVGFDSAKGVEAQEVRCGFSTGKLMGCEPMGLHVGRIGPHRSPAQWLEVKSVQGDSCPEGLIQTGNGCVGAKGEASALEALPIEKWQLDCEAGRASSCRILGLFSMDESRKDRLWRGCALGDAVACGAAAEVLLEKSDPEQGREAWRRACEGGLGTLCFSLGFHVQKEPEEGFDAYTAWVRGCQRGNQASCYQAAMLSMKRGGSPEEEARLLEASCSGTQPLWQGCLEWAARMEKGELSPLTAKDAAQLYERVCEMKIKQGCRQAARLAKARGQDAQASEWLGKSCTLGDLDACVEASELAEVFDKAKQKKWLEEGCQRFRHPPSCEKLKAL